MKRTMCLVALLLAVFCLRAEAVDLVLPQDEHTCDKTCVKRSCPVASGQAKVENQAAMVRIEDEIIKIRVKKVISDRRYTDEEEDFLKSIPNRGTCRGLRISVGQMLRAGIVHIPPGGKYIKGWAFHYWSMYQVWTAPLEIEIPISVIEDIVRRLIPPNQPCRDGVDGKDGRDGRDGIDGKTIIIRERVVDSCATLYIQEKGYGGRDRQEWTALTVSRSEIARPTRVSNYAESSSHSSAPTTNANTNGGISNTFNPSNTNTFNPTFNPSNTNQGGTISNTFNPTFNPSNTNQGGAINSTISSTFNPSNNNNNTNQNSNNNVNPVAVVVGDGSSAAANGSGSNNQTAPASQDNTQ